MSVLTDYSTNRMLSGTGNLIGLPRNALFNSSIELAVQALPLLADFAKRKNLRNENGLNHQLSLFMAKIVRQNCLPFLVMHQSIEDVTRGNSPAPDIGIHLDIDDDEKPSPRITAFEGKQLSTKLPKERHREYVIGRDEGEKHIPCGGIERFKLSIHGRELIHAGMIGYLQDGTPDGWRDHINDLISDLSCQEHDPAWSENEHLTLLITGGPVAKCSSVVCRKTGELHLMHLWINLVPE